MVELYLNSHIHIHAAVPNYLNTGITNFAASEQQTNTVKKLSGI
jgi:hypothetical protein